MRAFTTSVAAAVVVLASLLAPPAWANGIVIEDPTGVPQAPVGPRRAPVVLVSHEVEAVLHDRVADVVVEQTFRNRTDARLEGVYLFPLPEGASVQRFAMTMGGKMVEGEVIAADEARRVYQSIVQRRRDPGLLEYAGRGLYRARVFPIEPRGEIRVRLTFQQVLPEDAGTLEFRYPLATDRLNGEPVERVSVDVRIESDADVKAVYSPSHPVAVTREGDRKARASWERSGARSDRDFLLYVGRSPEAVGFSLVSHKGAAEDGTFLAVIAPQVAVADADRVPKDVVFVLDTSGSMDGGKIVQARRAISAGIEVLRPGDRFNVIAFSSGVQPFRDGLVAADAEAKKAARAWLEDRYASGGTNIEGALLQALSTRSGGRLFHVVFVTDGQPTIGERNPDAIVREALAQNPSKARVFTFGVGGDLDVGLLDRIAEGTGGTRDYVTSGEDLEISTGRFYAKVDSPVLADVKVDLGPGVYDVYPQRLPDLFSGQQVVLFGRYREAGARTVGLTGNVNGKPVSFEFQGALKADAGPAFLPRLWAQRKVAYLLDDVRLHGANAEVVSEITRLATRFAIVTPYTSGLVVEDAELEAGRRLRGTGAAAGLGQLGGDSGGQFGGASGSVPPGLRAPTGLTPPPPYWPGPPNTTPSDPAQPPAPTTPMAPPTGAPAASKPVEESLRLRKAEDAKDAESAGEAGGSSATVKTVGTRTFARMPDGRWADTAWDRKAETKKVEAWSEAYMALLSKGDEIARILSLGDRVVFVLDGTVYEVVPAPGAAPGR